MVYMNMSGEYFMQSPNDEIQIEIPPCSSQSSPSEVSEGEAPRSVTVDKHYKPCPPCTSLATRLYVAPANQAGIERRAVLGMSGRGRGNVLWQAGSGQSQHYLVLVLCLLCGGVLYCGICCL